MKCHICKRDFPLLSLVKCKNCDKKICDYNDNDNDTDNNADNDNDPCSQWYRDDKYCLICYEIVADLCDYCHKEIWIDDHGNQCDVCFKKLCSGCVTGRNAFSPKCKDCYKKAPPPTPIYADIETYFTSKGCNK